MTLIKDTLYAKYIQEREGLEILEDESSFITYKIASEECFIANMFIDQEKRKTGKCRQLIETLSKIAKDHDCKYLSATIDLKDNGHDQTLLAAIKVGFKTVRANNEIIMIVKELGDE